MRTSAIPTCDKASFARLPAGFLLLRTPPRLEPFVRWASVSTKLSEGQQCDQQHESGGNCHDNAVTKIFQLLKRERIRRKTYATRDEARSDIFDYIEMFYKPKRRHGSAMQLSPVEYEKRHFLSLESVYKTRSDSLDMLVVDVLELIVRLKHGMIT